LFSGQDLQSTISSHNFKFWEVQSDRLIIKNGQGNRLPRWNKFVCIWIINALFTIKNWICKQIILPSNTFSSFSFFFFREAKIYSPFIKVLNKRANYQFVFFRSGAIWCYQIGLKQSFDKTWNTDVAIEPAAPLLAGSWRFKR